MSDVRSDTRLGSEAAFPLLDHNGTSLIMREPGLTMREWFAGLAMQGLVANTGTCGDTGAPHTIASRAVEVADALLKELAK